VADECRPGPRRLDQRQSVLVTGLRRLTWRGPTCAVVDVIPDTAVAAAKTVAVRVSRFDRPCHAGHPLRGPPSPSGGPLLRHRTERELSHPVNLAAWTPDLPGHRRRLAEVPDYIAGCVPLHELVHSQAPDRTVREVQTSDCCLNSYLVKEIINPQIAVDSLGRSLFPGCCHGRSFGRSPSTCQSRRGRSWLPLRTSRFALWLCGGGLDGRSRYLVPPPLWLLRQGKNAARRTLRPCYHGLTTSHCRTSRPKQSP